MHILFLTENFPPETNAAAARVYERATYWADWGHQVTVITCAPNFPNGKLFDGYHNTWYQTEEMTGIKVVRVKTYITANQGVIRRSLDFFSFLFTGFFAGLFQSKPDVIVATSPQFFAAVAGWSLGVARCRPFVFELGDLWPTSISAVGAMQNGFLLSTMERLELFLYRRSALVVALTHAFKANLVSRQIPAGQIQVVLNGVDLHRYGPRERSISLAAEWNIGEKFVIGYVGTHGMAHGLQNVLDAAERLKEYTEILFLFVGAGAERDRLIHEAKSRGMSNVKFKQSQPKDLMPEIWSLCNVALVHLKNAPAFAEVMPSKIFEAMAMGLPILLVSPEGEASQLIGFHGAGSWVPAGNPEKLATTILSLSGDKDILSRYAQASLDAAQLHSREKQAQKMLSVFEQVVRG